MVSGASQGELAGPGMWEGKCRPFGITPEQGRVLNHLFLADGQVNLTQRAGVSMLQRGNFSMFCRRLEQAGHIAMAKNDKDARFINVALTEKGGHWSRA